MPAPATLAAFALAARVLLVIPGPAVTYVVTRSLEGDRSAGLASVFGIHTGTLAYIATGLSFAYGRQ